MDRARGRGSAPVRDRLGQRADQFTGRGRTVSANDREGRAAADSGSGAATRARAEARRIHGRRVCLQARRAGQAGHHPRLRCRSRSEDSFDPRTIPIDGSEGGNSQLHAQRDAPVPRHARSGRGQRAADVRRDRLLRQQQCPSAAPRVWHARAACWPGRRGRPSWTRTTCPTPSTSSRRWLSRRSGRRRCDGRRSWAPSASWSVAVEDNKSSITHSGRARQGRVSDAGPDHASPLRGLARARASARSFSAGRASARRRASRTT